MTTLTTANPALGGNAQIEGYSPAGPPSAGGLTPGDIFSIIRQRLLSIIFLGGFIAAIGVGAVIFWYVKYPGYSAEAYIEVTSPTPADPNTGIFDDKGLTDKDIERAIQAQIVRLQSPSVLSQVVRLPEIRNTYWRTWAGNEAQRTNQSEIDILKNMLSVSPVPQSGLVRISSTWRVKAEVPLIVNSVVKEYLQEVNKVSKDEIVRELDRVDGELDRTRKLLDNKNTDIKTLATENDYSGSAGSAIDVEVLELTAQRTELELIVINLKAQAEQFRQTRPEDIAIDPEMQEMLRNDPEVYQATQREQAARENFDAVAARFGPNHDLYKQSQDRLELAENRLREIRAQRLIDFQVRRIEEVERQYNNANGALIEIQEKLNTAQAKQKDKDAKLVEQKQLEEDKILIQNEYQRLAEQKSELEKLNRQDKGVRIETIQNAIEPTRISQPNLKLWLPVAVFFGFGFSTALAFALHFIDKSVRTPRDVSNAHLPVLGTIPTTDDDEVEIERVETACLDAPHSVVAEAFRNLRANLFFSAPAEQQGVILVTSPSGGNGKTTVATNLAISIALSGRRVLLVDANFRRAATSELFENMKVEGLSNILIGQGQLRDYVTTTSVPGLDVLSAGPVPQNPAELLGSSYLRDVIVDARSRYDQVIFDGPPVLLVSDAMVLAGAVDGCLLVCQYRKTSRGALQRTRSNLESINARIFGAVLNEVQSRRGGYFRKQYREFYDYHEVDEDKAPRPTLEIAHGDFDDDDGPSGGAPAPGPVPPPPSGPTDTVVAETARSEPRTPRGNQPVVDNDLPDLNEADGSVLEDSEMSATDSDLITPSIDTGSAVDLGALPDLSDLEELDIRSDFDIDSGSLETGSTTDAGNESDEGIDIDELADELEEIGNEGFDIADDFDMGEDSQGDERKPDA